MTQEIPTQEQIKKTDELRAEGYIWNQAKSISACGVVMEKGDDMWFFGLGGEIMHNPEGPTIKV